MLPFIWPRYSRASFTKYRYTVREALVRSKYVTRLWIRLHSTMFTAEEMAAVESISALTLSEDTSRALYCVEPVHRPGKNTTSALWLAETAVEHSARQITSGAFHDFSPKFHPQTSEVFFLSDRHNLGGPVQLYQFKLSALGGDPIPLTPLTNEKGVSSFAFSPNGKYVAFISPDETNHEVDRLAHAAKIWNEKKDLGRLRLIELSDETKQRVILEFWLKMRN